MKRLNEAAASYQAAISLEDRAEAHRRLAEVYDALERPEDRARERARYVAMQLEALRQRSAP